MQRKRSSLIALSFYPWKPLGPLAIIHMWVLMKHGEHNRGAGILIPLVRREISRRKVYNKRETGSRHPGGGVGQDIVCIIQDQDIQRMGMPQPLSNNKKSFVALVTKMCSSGFHVDRM